jgi:hypothetical protein
MLGRINGNMTEWIESERNGTEPHGFRVRCMARVGRKFIEVICVIATLECQDRC